MKYILTYSFLFLTTLGFSQSGLFKSIGQGLNWSVWGFANDTVNNKLYTYGPFTKTGNDNRLLGIGVWNGIKWDSLHHIIGNTIAGFQKIQNHGVYGFGSDLSKLNPVNQTWNTITTSDNGGISFLTNYQNDLVIIGTFENINNQTIKRIARYDGSNFTAFDNTPFIGSISTAVEFQGKLYIAGNFQVNNTCGTLRKFAYWDESSNCWKQKDNGVVGAFGGVNKMIVYKNKLYVAGSFFKQDGNYGNCIFSYDGTNYDDLGGGFTGINDKIRDMFIYKDKLIITGLGWSNLPGSTNLASNFISYDGNKFCNYFPYQPAFNGFGAIENYNDTLVFSTNTKIVGSDTVNFIAKYMGDLNNPIECVNVVGIKEEQYFNSVKIYPNPTSNKFKIEFSTYIESAVLINVLGQSVMDLTVNELKNEIDMDNLPKGIYFLNLQANGLKKVFKILKE